jgi:hypothetical protein
MHIYTRMNLEATIRYHSDLADYYKMQVDAEGEQPPEPPPGQSPDESSPAVSEPDQQYQPTEEAPAEEPDGGEEQQEPKSAAAMLHALNADIAKQLREVLDANPVQPTIEEQRAARPVTRGRVTRRATLH